MCNFQPPKLGSFRPPLTGGNATRSYLYAYRSERAANAGSNERVYRNASVQGSRVLRDAGVRARVRALQEQALEEAMARLRPWIELAVAAQETLYKALTGDLRFPEVDSRLEPEMIRSAIRAAEEVLDRALGTSRQMHEHHVGGQAIVVHVAGPGEAIELGREVQVPRA